MTHVGPEQLTAQDLEQLTTAPLLYPFQFDWAGERALVLKVDDSFYKNAAFLDQRAGISQLPGAWLSLADLRQRLSGAPPRPLGFIFHIGHCGSTLLSRAIGLLENFFSLREPLPLRDLANFWAERDAPWSPLSETELYEMFDLMRVLWGRTPGADQRAIVKATSFCSSVAPVWLKRYPTDKALLLAMAPEKYIATMLGAPAYLLDIKGSARTRMLSLMESTGSRTPALHSMSPGQLAAMSYFASLLPMELATHATGQAMRIDFDEYLADPLSELLRISAHLGFAVENASLVAALNSPVLARYSKATEFKFSEADRAQRLDSSRQLNRREIRAGLDWIDDFSTRHALAETALANFGYQI